MFKSIPDAGLLWLLKIFPTQFSPTHASGSRKRKKTQRRIEYKPYPKDLLVTSVEKQSHFQLTLQ